MKFFSVVLLGILFLSCCTDDSKRKVLVSEDEGMPDILIVNYEADLYPLLDDGKKELVDKEGNTLTANRPVHLRRWHQIGWSKALKEFERGNGGFVPVPQGSTAELEMLSVGEKDGQGMINELLKSHKAKEIRGAIKLYFSRD